MKHFAAFAVAFALLVSASQAVTWRVVTLSVTVNLGPDADGGVTTTKLTSRKYLEEGARRFGDPDLKNYFVGVRTDTGVIAVVHIPTETPVYNVNSGLGVTGNARNTANTTGTVVGSATVSSLNTDFAGHFYEKYTRNADGSLKSLSRVFIGGGGPGAVQTLTGTARVTAKKFEL